LAKHDVLVVIPTLRAGAPLRAALDSLAAQTWRDFEVIVVDNSGKRAAAPLASETRFPLRMLYLGTNLGYGAAVNRAVNRSEAPLIAVLNDDAVAHPGWLEALTRAAAAYPEFGMFSCQIRLANTPWLDSTGLVMSRDGSSIQRAHKQPFATDLSPDIALMPSGCAALYRRKAMQDAGHFDVDFFLYGEDTDLGLRMIWQRWPCRYVPEAIVEHAYSATAGLASPLKAYLVERNRLYLVIRNFPFTDAVAAVGATPWRYTLHLVALLTGTGKAAQFSKSNSAFWLPWMVVKAHLAVLLALPRLLHQRNAIRRHARVSKERFRKAIYTHRVSLWKVAHH